MRFIVCGEALIDLIPDTDQLDPKMNIWRAFPGGGPMNTAVALTRLNEDCHFLGRFGNDAMANQISDYLRDNQVALDLAAHSSQPTMLAMVNLAENGSASYVFHTYNTATCGWRISDFPKLTSDDWFHFGSLAAVIEPGDTALAEFVSNTEAKLSYDLNIRPSVISDMDEYWKKTSRFMDLVGRKKGLVRASDEDILNLTGSGDPIKVAKQWCNEFGISNVIITLGANGAVAVSSADTIKVPGIKIDVVDTVGAGDTFTAGFLSSYVANGDLEFALRTGVCAAAINCQRSGANPPTKDELNQLLS